MSKGKHPMLLCVSLYAVFAVVCVIYGVIHALRKVEEEKRRVRELTTPGRWQHCANGHWYFTDAKRQCGLAWCQTQLVDATPEEAARLDEIAENDLVRLCFANPYTRYAFVRYMFTLEQQTGRLWPYVDAMKHFRTQGLAALKNETPVQYE